MEKSIKRQIRQFEKTATKVGLLNDAAARLLNRAKEIEVTQKAAFDDIVVKSARAFGLDRLPLSVVISGFAALQSTSTAEFNPIASGADPVSAAEPVERDGDANVQAIDLIVRIGRNTTQQRFALLDKHLIWNGREGRWCGGVSLAILDQFKELFEPRRLIYSGSSSGSADDRATNTTILSGEILTDDNGSTEPTASDGMAGADKGGDVSPSDGTNSVKPTSGDPIATIGNAVNDGGKPTEGDEEAAGASEPPAAAPAPRSPFAGLSRRGGGSR
jgi:hypothetical protein